MPDWFQSRVFPTCVACALLLGNFCLSGVSFGQEAKTDRISKEERASKKERERSDALEKSVPESVEDLRAIQSQMLEVVEKALPATVALLAGVARGSGVIVSEDGLVLTAGHVSGRPGRSIQVVLADGRRVRGVVLGWGEERDLGLVRITEPGEWPHLEIGSSSELRRGDWCVALGHPGGYERNRPPVVRNGRVLSSWRRSIRSDCTIASGDSGGPLIDMKGRVVGIHSRIGLDANGNYHTPSDRYLEDWDRLLASERWGRSTLVIGVYGRTVDEGCLVTGVVSGLPAEKAGIREDDVLLKVAGFAVTDWESLGRAIQQQRVGSRIVVELQRGAERLSVRVEVALGT